MVKNLALLGLFLIQFGCQTKENSKENTLATISDRKVLQYAIEGKKLYESNCANCHQTDGTGLGKLIPPLKDSDYMNADLGRTAVIIKHGQEGEIVVNGQSYNKIMPANPHLTNMEIGQIMTYLYNIWGNKEGVVSSKDVDGYLSN